MINPYYDLFCALEKQPVELRLRLRKNLIWAYSWAVPSPEAIEALAAFSPLVEIGAGTGYWAWLAMQAGAKVLAYDNQPDQPPHWVPVLYGTSESSGGHADHALFLCWPPLNEKMAEESLRHYRGNTVIYVGEFQGRTANDAFHFQLRLEFSLEREIVIPCWPGFNDRLFIFQRKSPREDPG